MAFGIAVVGLDHWYTAFGVLDIAAASETVQLVGIADPDATRLAEVGKKYGQAQAAADYRDLLKRDDVALVAICAPTDQAPTIAKAALTAGKHVISVKPPARTLAELDEVLALAAETGLFYGSFEGMQRLHPKSQRLRELIAEGAIGQPVSYHQVGHGGLPSPWPGQPGGAPSWWINAPQVPGGAWLDHAIYAIDLARYIFDGEIDLPTVTGLTDQLVHKTLGLEDYGAALMRLEARGENAARVTLFIEDTWAADGKQGGGAHSLDIIGTAGILRFDGKANAWVVSKTNAESVSHPVAASPFFVLDALPDVVAAHRRGEAASFGAADARANLQACLQFLRRGEVSVSPEVLKHFGVRLLAPLGGRLNRHWRVESRCERLVLRRWGTRSEPDIAFELRLLAHIAALGWPVPSAVADVLEWDGHFWSLFPFLPGEPVSADNPEAEQRARGRLMARFHDDLGALPEFGQRGTWRRCEEILADPSLDRVLCDHEPELPEDIAILRWHLDRARMRLAEISPGERADIIVHGDFTPWNLRFQNGRLSGILDFELSHRDHRIGDFALSWRGKYDAVVHGYNEVAPLDPEEWALLTPLWWAGLIDGVCRDLSNGVSDDGWSLRKLLQRSALMGPDAKAYP